MNYSQTIFIFSKFSIEKNNEEFLDYEQFETICIENDLLYFKYFNEYLKISKENVLFFLIF